MYDNAHSKVRITTCYSKPIVSLGVHQGSVLSLVIVCTPFMLDGGGVQATNKFSKKGGALTESHFLEEVAAKEGVTFFMWVAVFT